MSEIVFSLASALCSSPGLFYYNIWYGVKYSLKGAPTDTPIPRSGKYFLYSGLAPNCVHRRLSPQTPFLIAMKIFRNHSSISYSFFFFARSPTPTASTRFAEPYIIRRKFLEINCNSRRWWASVMNLHGAWSGTSACVVNRHRNFGNSGEL